MKRWVRAGNPIGTRLLLDGEWRTIVGVAADVRKFHLNVAPAPALYLPYAQRPVGGVALLLRVRRGDPLTMAGKTARRQRRRSDAVRGGHRPGVGDGRRGIVGARAAGRAGGSGSGDQDGVDGLRT